MKRLFATNSSSANNLPMLGLNPPVVNRVKDDDWMEDDDNWSIQLKRWQVILRAQVGNITFMQKPTEKPLKAVL